MTDTWFSVIPNRDAITGIQSKYQYRLTKIPLLSVGNSFKKVFIVFTSSLRSISCSTLSVPDTISAISSKTAETSPPPRLVAVMYLYRFNDRFLVIFPRNADKILGLCGGMVFHALMYVSLTHSSASSLLFSIFSAIEAQYLPYLSAVTVIACSFLSQYSWTICASSIGITSLSYLPFHLLYTTFGLKSYTYVCGFIGILFMLRMVRAI